MCRSSTATPPMMSAAAGNPRPAAEHARIEQARAWDHEVASIATTIRTSGERPDDPIVLGGEPDISGGGAWFVIQPDAIGAKRFGGHVVCISVGSLSRLSGVFV